MLGAYSPYWVLLAHQACPLAYWVRLAYWRVRLIHDFLSYRLNCARGGLHRRHRSGRLGSGPRDGRLALLLQWISIEFSIP